MTFRRCAALAASAVLVAVFVAGAAGAGSPDPAFSPSGLIAAGASPHSFVTARLDGDDNLDLAFANRKSNGVTVLLGDGAGHFRPAAGSPITAGDFPASVRTADFNSDGVADLAVANGGSKDVTVLLGNGSGSFSQAPGSTVKLARSPGRFASADLNGDGRVDLAVPASPNRVAILLGDGSGRFGAAPGSPITIGGSGGPNDVEAADFNKDGKPDLAVSTTDPMKIAILLGDGAGRFRSLTTMRARLLAVADFNGDGKADVAAATQASPQAPVTIRVLLGTGSGRFSPAVGFPLEDEVYGYTEVAVADFNIDHRLDLALAGYDSTTPVLLGDGRGRLRPAFDSPFPLPASSSGSGDVAAADLNRDGQPDLVFSIKRSLHRGGDSGLAVLWQSPSGPATVPGGLFPGLRDAAFSTRTPITDLAADGTRAAVATESMTSCGPIRIIVWTAPRRKSATFNNLCGGDGVSDIALGGGQVAWIDKRGGNDLELRLMVAKLSGKARKEIDFETNGARAAGSPRGQWVAQLLGGGPLLAYNRWAIVCKPEDYGCDPPSTIQVTDKRLVRIIGGRLVVAKRGPDSYPLSAVGGGRMVVESAGALNVLTPNGSRVATVPAAKDDPPRSIALSRTRLAVLRTSTLALYEPATGKETKPIPLGPAATLQLAGVNSKLALLRGPRRLIVVRLSDGKLISLALRSKSHVDAKLTTAGLFYAYNVRRGLAKGRIVFEPTAKLLARF
jgi:hypothetical protein